MAFIPIEDSGYDFDFIAADPSIVTMIDSVVTSTATLPEDETFFQIQLNGGAVNFRITALSYGTISNFGVSNGGAFSWNEGSDEQENTAMDFADDWEPTPFTGTSPGEGDILQYDPASGSEWAVSDVYQFLVEVEQVEPLPPYYVYELDKGWTFDGAYIPHFLELNWYFGDDPIHYHGIQKIRVHGLSKGRAYLTVAVNGMQTDYETDYTEPQILDLPRNPKVISVDLAPETNYTDSASRGLSIQMKFEGRNTDIALPEPQHALQVLIIQSSPQGTGFRSN